MVASPCGDEEDRVHTILLTRPGHTELDEALELTRASLAYLVKARDYLELFMLNGNQGDAARAIPLWGAIEAAKEYLAPFDWPKEDE